ncbi:MAG TPA: acyl-CoA dehydrogenase family protein, partial [Telluria sp.]|nr:acyl-CoA dehydrogenase family protein [Telluria sp.]
GKVQRMRCREMALQGQRDVVYVMPGSIFDRRGSRDQAPLFRPAPLALTPSPTTWSTELPQLATGTDQTSRATADAMIGWFRAYAARRLNSRMIDERRTIPPYVVLDLGNQGFFGLQIPARFGGKALDTVDLMRVLEQVAGVDLTVATLIGVHNGLGVRPILHAASPQLRAQWLPSLAAGRQLAAFALTEPDAGSNPLAIRASATRCPGGWIVNGEKQWIGLGAWASVTTVFAKAVDPAGGPLGIVALLVEAENPGLSQGPESLTMGMRGIVQNTVFLREAFVPDESVLLSAGEGLEVGREAMLYSRLGIGAMCVGAMKRCAQLMARYAARREIASGRLADHGVTIARLSDLTSAVFACEALVYAIASELDAGGAPPVEAYIACKTTTTEMLGDAADWLVQLLGGRGYIESNSAPQLLRDARVLRILEGPTETLYSHLGSSVGQKHSPAAEFMAGPLGCPELAVEFGTTIMALRAQAANSVLFDSAGALAQWLDCQLGELAACAFLLAATERRRDSAGDTAAAETATKALGWARHRYTELSRAILAKLATRATFGDATALLHQISGYADAIGDIDQELPGENHQHDPLLRRFATEASPSPQARVIPAGTAPPIPAPTGSAREVTAIQQIVHDCVMQWLRSEPAGAPENLDFDTPFTTLGMDSLATASISFELEQRIGFAIIPELLYDHQTVMRLAEFIENRIASSTNESQRLTANPSRENLATDAA